LAASLLAADSAEGIECAADSVSPENIDREKMPVANRYTTTEHSAVTRSTVTMML